MKVVFDTNVIVAGPLPPGVSARGSYAVSLERHPQDAGIAQRVVEDRLELPEGTVIDDRAPPEFAQWIALAGELAGKPPVRVDAGVARRAQTSRNTAATNWRFG